MQLSPGGALVVGSELSGGAENPDWTSHPHPTSVRTDEWDASIVEPVRQPEMSTPAAIYLPLERERFMRKERRVIDPSRLGDIGLRLIGTTDIDGNGTEHAIAHVDPLVLLDFVRIDTAKAPSFRPHPHVGLTAMSFLPKAGTWMAWDSLDGDTKTHLHAGGLYYVHAGQPAFHHEFPSPDTVAAGEEVEFIQLVWNATDERDVRTVVLQPDELPVVTLPNATIRVMAGDFCGVSAKQPFTHRKVIYSYIEIGNGEALNLELPASMRGILFPIEGAVRVNDTTVSEHQMMIFGEDDQRLSVEHLGTKPTSRLIIAAGEPVNRPFVKLLGLGGFIIGESEAEVRKNMHDLSIQAEQLKAEIPEYFPPQYR